MDDHWPQPLRDAIAWFRNTVCFKPRLMAHSKSRIATALVKSNGCPPSRWIVCKSNQRTWRGKSENSMPWFKRVIGALRFKLLESRASVRPQTDWGVENIPVWICGAAGSASSLHLSPVQRTFYGAHCIIHHHTLTALQFIQIALYFNLTQASTQ